jgi:multidrug efflux pump subunit AcrA (membrane-fusion protein)
MLQSITKILIISLFIFLQQSLFASEWGKPKETEKKLFNVQVVESFATIVNNSIDFSSTTEASRRIEIKSEVMTTVDQVMIKAGTLVKKGQHIIKLDDFDTNKELFDIDLLSQNEFNKVALFAPFSGILLDGHKIGGELVMPGEKVYELIDLSSLKIFGYINENEILSISLNNEVSISILGEEIEGKIDYISPISDPDTKTFEIVVKVDNKNYRYKDGLSSMISIKRRGSCP